MRTLLSFALSLLGLFDSLYLWWVYTSPSRPMVCLGTGCDVVRASPYAFFHGVPLPVFGAAMYLVLALAIFAETLVSQPTRRALRWAVAVTAGAGFLVSLYLTGIEAFVLHAWCAWCVVSAIAIALIFALALRELLAPLPEAEPAAALVALKRQFAVLVVAVFLALPSFYFLSRRGEVPPLQAGSPETLSSRLVRPDNHLTGNPEAAVTVVEFADFECRYCGRAEETVRRVREQLGGKIRFVFRHFPQTKLHPHAQEAAEASECAAEQGKFWEAAEKFYVHQDDLSEAALERYARELGLDAGRFQECLRSGKMAARVHRDVEDARALGVRFTPTFFIGRRVVEGTPEFRQFVEWIEQETGAFAQAQPGPGPVSRDLPTPAVESRKDARPVAKGAALSSAKAGSSGPGAASPHPATNPRTPESPPDALTGGTGIFEQFQTAGMTCSEEEAARKQPTMIRTPEARQLFERRPQVLFVDVRSPQEFAKGRIRGSLNVPVDDIGQRWAELPKDRSVVLYESGTSPGDICASSRAAGRVLLAHGFAYEHVKVYQDGLADWEKQGFPVEH